MNKEAQIKIQLLSENDLADAMRLIQQANWNQTKQDWLRLLTLEPQGCFAAWLHGRLVATITTTTYGTELAWIGMMFVDPECRRRGIATKLMRAAMDYLHERGIAAVKLDATMAGQPVYELLGFVREELIERWEAVALPANSGGISVLGDEMRRELRSLDRKAFNADRASLLDTLLSDSCVKPVSLVTPEGRLKGYALARQGTAAYYVGPVVATDEQTALWLLDGMMNQLAGEKVYLDYFTGFGIESSALLNRGFVKQRDLIRMRYGKESGAGASTMVFAIAGPELG